MATIDRDFREIALEIINGGVEYQNKNRGTTKRLQIPSYTYRHHFDDGFPVLGIKSVPYKKVVGELLWFLRGDNDIEYLNDNNIKFWNKDAYNWYCKIYSNNDPIEGQEEHYRKNEDGSYRMFTFKEFSARGKGSVGQNYSVQWRNFGGKVDQIKDLIAGMKEDIMSSRLKVNAWNPAELNDTALPPCHSEFQIIGVPLSYDERQLYFQQMTGYDLEFSTVEDSIRIMDEYDFPEFGFELHWNQRSVDTFLGLPFNIASYATLAKLLEKLTGFPALAIEGTLKCVHFYDNQYDAVNKNGVVPVNELLSRDSNTIKSCELQIRDPKVGGASYDMLNEDLDFILEHLEIDDFELIGYNPLPAIPCEMLAPTKL